MPEYAASTLADGLYAIDEAGVRCFLATGERESMLVDTGACGGDLRAFCETLTDRPIFVVNTHADRDHIAARRQFGRVHMHPAEFAYYASKGGDARAALPLWEGECLSVGAYAFEVVHIPGHTPGSVALLERSRRFLIAGDSVSKSAIYMFGEGRSFPAYVASLEKLRVMSGRFDLVYASHGEVAPDPAQIDRLLDGARRFLAGEGEGREPNVGRAIPARLYEYGEARFLAAREAAR